MSRALPKYNKRRVLIAGGAAAVVLSGAVIAGNALAGEGDSGAQAGSPGTVSCPAVAGSLPAVPASAQAEIDRNLALLETQISEANQRLIDTVGQGGPNFVQNAILGPLEDKRVATINRMATAIGRTAEKPAGLDALAPCTLNAAGGGDAGAGDAGAGDAGAGDAGAGDAGAGDAGAGDAGAGDAGAGDAGAGDAGAGDAGAGDAGAGDAGAGDAGAGDAGAGDAGAGDAGAGNAGAAGTVNCPDVAGSLPAVPASAQAEIDRNLALLDTQIAEANQRITDTVGQGGPNFVQNAILGPLADKRVSTINRMATAIGRTAEKPVGLDALAPCTLN